MKEKARHAELAHEMFSFWGLQLPEVPLLLIKRGRQLRQCCIDTCLAMRLQRQASHDKLLI